jgi:anti-sigma B factor antagonist
MPETFEAQVRFQGGVPIIGLRGEVNASAEQALDAAYQQASRGGATSLLLNFENATYINSTGIALVVGVLAKARKNRQKVLVCGLSDHYREIFQVTRLADFMSIHDEEQAAIAEAATAAV